MDDCEDAARLLAPQRVRGYYAPPSRKESRAWPAFSTLQPAEAHLWGSWTNSRVGDERRGAESCRREDATCR